jgi:hypothetical protein
MDSGANINTVLAQVLVAANQLLGTSAKTWEELVDANLLPPRLGILKKLTVFYEQQMLACRDAKAYFPACVMGSAMLEALLLFSCMLNREQVEKTSRYRARAGKQDFERVLCSIGFEDLVEISAELDWIPSSLISNDWKVALPEAYREIAKERRPKMNGVDRDRRACSLSAHPAYSLMLLLNMMRNRVHPGRWVREGHVLADESAFADWAQVALVAAAHIRDCLVVHLLPKDMAILIRNALAARLTPTP